MGVDDIAFHSRVFGLERHTPATFAALLWDLTGHHTDRATTRVARWTRSLLGMKAYALDHGFTRRSAEAARVAVRLECPTGTVATLAALGAGGDEAGAPVPIATRILEVAQVATIWGETLAPREVAARLARRAGDRFDPQVVRETVASLAVGFFAEPAVWVDALARVPRGDDGDGGYGPSLSAVTLAGVFAAIVDTKSPFTGGHSLRVASLAGAMATAAGAGAGGDPSAVILAALLHDLGKLAIPNSILDKNGPLDPAEWAIMHRHPADSARIIGEVPGWAAVAAWAEAHHERPDGRGYHRRLAGAVVPLAGRLLAAADAFDAMTADRPYRMGMAPDEALRHLRAGSGTQFDPFAVELLAGVVNTPAPLSGDAPPPDRRGRDRPDR